MVREAVKQTRRVVQRIGGPLNGQIFRQQLFRDLFDRLAPRAVLETRHLPRRDH